jgi:hypothetical protein
VNNEQQSQFDELIRQKLREVSVPVGLTTRILAKSGARRAPVVWRWLASAAAVLVMVAIIFVGRPDNSFAGYRREMIRFVSAEYKVDFHADNLDDVRRDLATHGYPAGYALPPGLHNISVEGSCLRHWRAHKVSLICMETKGHDMWLFVIEHHALPDAPPPDPVFANIGKIATASWTTGDYTCILASVGDEAELKSYL